MKRFLLFLLSTTLSAQEMPMPDKTSASVSSIAPMVSPPNNKSIVVIDSKSRANDYIQAFELLKKDKPTLKIMIRTTSGLLIPSVSEMSAAQNGTLLLLKVLSSQGMKYQILPIEEIAEIGYS